MAKKLIEIIQGTAFGLYHVTNRGFCSWFEFAREILRQGGLGPVAVSPIASSAAGRPAARPRNSRLANRHLEVEGLGLLPQWQDALGRYLRERREHQEET